ncbi:MAG: 2-oxo acid dehydrogenase subunit E2 [Caldilineae bacterium]|nr:2-oxo acid dehydrogenase subunit E2 [Caldilineae bacterium]
MAVELKMPQLGESVHEGTIGKWLKQEGERVEKYDPVLEVITDKVDTEVTAVESGVLLKILVAEDETVAVGTVLAIIGEAGEAVEAPAGKVGAATAAASAPAASAPASPAPVAAPAPAPTSTPLPAGTRVSPVAARMAAEHGVDLGQVGGSGRGGQITRQDVAQHLAGTAPAAALGSAASAPPADREIGFISPRVAGLAARHGVDLRRVPGSGRDGRITARDVEAFVESGAAAAAAVAPAGVAGAIASPTAASPSPASGVAGSGSSAGPALGDLVPMTRMRKLIADHMVHSKQTSPHVTTVHEVDMSAVMAANARLKPQLAARGIKLTLTAFMMQCLAEAIASHPLVNSSWTEAGIQIHRDINIGMAVALPGGGLIVPVIKRADSLSLAGMADAVGDLANRARDNQLRPDDIQGGSFTVTNYGTLGSLFGTPVINQPQCAILGTGAIKKRVVVVQGPDGSDQIAIRPMMLLALTFDHRILDGGTADPFVQTLVQRLERYSA